MNIIIAQFFGLFALITLCGSYQKQTKKDFLYLQIFANIFYMVQYFILGLFSASIANLVGASRGFILFKQGEKSNILTLIIFETILVISGIITCNSFISIIPILLAMTYTYGVWQKKLKVTFAIGIFVSIIWIYVNIKVAAYVSVLASILELVSSTLGLIKLYKNKL